MCNISTLTLSSLLPAQAKIFNGSKILVTRQKLEPEPPRDEIDLTGGDDVGGPGEGQEDRETDILRQIEEVERQAQLIGQSVELTDNERLLLSERREEDRQDEYKRLRKECYKFGEQFMRLLETLDSFVVSDRLELRTRRKAVATQLNRSLDLNDRVIRQLSDAIRMDKNGS